jgi:muramoyltetrapeptide carboxypeptidase LdcA involved in peptidoglycan recycling
MTIAPNVDGWTCAPFEWGNPARNAKKRPLQPCSGWKWLQGAGQHRGRLLGGCLEAVDWLRGTPVWPDLPVWRNSLLFLETSEDQPPPANVRYMLRSLAAVGVLNEARGILFGRPYNEDEDDAKFSAYDDVLLQVLKEQGLTSIPVVTRMDFGHTDPSFVVPYGVEAEIDCERRQFRLLEPPTSA